MSLLHTDWPTALLGRLVSINERALAETTDPDYTFRYLDIASVGRGEIAEEPTTFRFENAPSRARRILRRGDTIVSTVRTYLRAVLPIRDDASDLIASTGFAVLSPGSDIDSRFLSWYAQSDPFIEEVVARSVGVSYPAIAPSELAQFPVPTPALAEQRAIADFLDAETDRIDALIAKKYRLWELLLERRAGHIEHAIRSLMDEWGEAPLKYLVREVTVGIVVTPAAWYSETGVPALRGQNVKPGRIILDDLVYLTEDGHALHKKSELRSGDVVVVRTGQAGAAAVVTSEVAGANCIDLIIVRPGPAMDASFLEHVLNYSDWTQKHVEQHSVGTIQSHFNVSAMKEVPVPSVPVHQQREVVKSLGRLTDRIDATVARLNRQIALLSEHRQALINAAVTGRIEVLGAAASHGSGW